MTPPLRFIGPGGSNERSFQFTPKTLQYVDSTSSAPLGQSLKIMNRLPIRASSSLTKSLRGTARLPLRTPAVYQQQHHLPRLDLVNRATYQPAPRVRTYAIMSTQSHACCTVPPVSVDYKEKGSFTTVEGMKTYQTGSSSAKSGLLVVYDIFGFFPQTLQGADILATGDKDKPRQVFMPGEHFPGPEGTKGIDC